jgi:hypothetical protein
MKQLLERFLILFIKKPKENNAEDQADSAKKKNG